jgi:hypothetical protein
LSADRVVVDVSRGDLLIVTSHDCDVTNASFTLEPYVELIVARPVQIQDGNCSGGKNPRRLHLAIETPGGSRPYAFEAHQRVAIERRALLGVAPATDHTLRFSDRRLLGVWLAKRYDRAAFPDAFNARTRPATTRIRRVLRQGGNHVSAIFIALVDDELPDGEAYRIVVRAVMSTDHFDDAHRRLDAQRCLDALVAVLSECEGVETLEHTLVTDSEFTLADAARMKRWDFDWLSPDAD